MKGLAFILLVLLALSIAGGHDRQREALIEDTTRSTVQHAAAPQAPKEKPPIGWRLNSVCLIQPLGGVHVV